MHGIFKENLRKRQTNKQNVTENGSTKSSIVREHRTPHKTKDCVACKLCKSDFVWHTVMIQHLKRNHDGVTDEEGGSVRAGKSLWWLRVLFYECVFVYMYVYVSGVIALWVTYLS